MQGEKKKPFLGFLYLQDAQQEPLGTEVFNSKKDPRSFIRLS